MRKVDCGEIKEPRRAAISKVDGGGSGKKGRRGVSCDLGGLLVREPVQRKLPGIRQESDEGLAEADVHESM
jgi:hypothetical protein